MRVALIADGGRYHGRELGPWEQDWLAGGEGKVYGPGCVVSERLDPAGGSPFTPRVALVPAGPAAWIVTRSSPTCTRPRFSGLVSRHPHCGRYLWRR